MLFGIGIGGEICHSLRMRQMRTGGLEIWDNSTGESRNCPVISQVSLDSVCLARLVVNIVMTPDSGPKEKNGQYEVAFVFHDRGTRIQN